DDRAADAESVLMQQEFLLRIRPSIEVVARVEDVVAMEVVSGAVEVVGTGLEAEVDDRAGFPSILGCWILLRVEFLDGVDGQDGSRRSLHAFGIDDGGAVVRVVVVGAVDDEVVVLRTIAVRADRKKAAAGRALDAGPQYDQVL